MSESDTWISFQRTTTLKGIIEIGHPTRSQKDTPSKHALLETIIRHVLKNSHSPNLSLFKAIVPI